ncbi:hypothetical protein Lqui_0808 [Legionella quinlivanii]|uniref:O-GlcNAc transferase C-terminal domain-containing protein n=1 Tax=Legionella quinlivanii TaxID=45073 RepID=A0A0W0Y4L4_9GAMM|nr:hypothetical protein [Legionella quinlivanii]KTD51964.1 hypothetical protein Lqui_0808 [Legionella quinlivanii]SEF86018.1 Glycosyl transferase family 41 [Legionella quinlivanii DSM 21216]STY09573.1 Predicted O-linked N-acetylglucosamine transferase, SPINDLY family [Legionella quinlivanii]
MTLYNLIKKVTPPKAKRYIKAALYDNKYINFARVTLGIRRNRSESLIRLWQFAEQNRSGKAEKIYQRLSRLERTNLTNYTLSALATLRLKNAEGACEIFEQGMRIYPEDNWLRIYYLQTCAHHNYVQRYFRFMQLISGAELTNTSAADFYKEVINAGIPLSFLINYHTIKQACTPDEFKSLQQYFISHISKNHFDFQTAKSAIYLGKHLDIETEFFQNMYETACKSFHSKKDSQKILHNLKVIASLSLPFIPSEEAITEFIESCKQLASESITLNSPSKDLLFEWGSWQCIFTSPDAGARQYHHAMRALERFSFSTWPELNYTASHVVGQPPTSRNPAKKIRIGFIVYDFMPMMSGLLRRLDKNLFETVYLRPGNESNSNIAKGWLASTDNIVEFPADDTKPAIKIIAAQKLDIIVSGPSTLSMFFPLMARLAHLQMILLEPNWTNGLTNSDYYISWRPAEPVKPDEFYQTAVSYLEHPPYWIERPAHTASTTLSETERDEIRKRLLNCGPEQHIYLCANTPPKVHPLMDEMFHDLLKADPDARIAILRSDIPSGTILKARLTKKLGQDINRCIFLTTLTKQDAHSLLMSVDCCLDSFPLCGMSSSFDAMMLGVPVVTLPFDIPFGKWTASIYNYIGVSGLVASNQREYIELAMRVAADKLWREQKIQEIKEKSSLYVESVTAFEELQNFLIKAWERKLAGLPHANWINGEWQGQ